MLYMSETNLIKEEINSNIVRISSECYIDKNSTESVVTGLALPFDKISRNEFTYNTESIKKSHKSLEGATVLFNHNPERVLGHVVSTSINEEGMNYKIDFDPNEKEILNKIKRRDLSKVSIQCIFDVEKSTVDEKTGITHAYINEFLELSIVSIPGFADTTAQLVESFKNKNKGEKSMAKDKKQEKAIPDEEKKKEELAKKEESDHDENDDDSKEEEDNDDKDVGERLEEIESRLEKIETFVKEQMGDDDGDKKKEEEEDDEDEKREEAIRKDKKTVSTETIKTEKTITTKQIKQALMEAD